MPPKKLDLFYIFIFIALNIILKSLYINFAEIALDEPFSIRAAMMPLNEIPIFLSHYNNPPLLEFILHPVVTLIGITSPAVRIPSLLFASLTVVFVYLIGTRFFSRKIGVFASLFYTFSTFQIYFSHEARTYALFNLLSCVSVFLFLTANQKPRQYFVLLCLITCNTLLVYAHYFGCIIWLLEVSWLLVFRWKSPKILLGSLTTFVVSGLLYTPQISILVKRYADASQTHWVHAPSAEDLYYNLMKMLNAPVATVLALSIFIAALVKLIRLRQKTFANENIIFVLHWFISAYFGLFVISFVVPVFLDRYLIFISTAIYLCLAIGIDYVFGEELSWPVQGVFVLVFVFSVSLKPDHGRRWKGLVETVESVKTTKTAVCIIPDWVAINYAYHYNPDYFADYHNTVSLLQQNNYYPLNNVNDFRSIPVDSFNQVILVDGGSEFVDKSHSVYKLLKQRFPEVSVNKSFVGADVYTFHK